MKLLGRDHPILVTLTGVTLLIHNIRSYVYIYIYILYNSLILPQWTYFLHDVSGNMYIFSFYRLSFLSDPE